MLHRARLYESLRTAHLERARELRPATILYSVTRYDFDPELAEGLSLVRTSGLGAARLLISSDVRELEINEPLMLSSLPSTALALVAIGVRDLIRRRRTLVVSYAIGNTDPFVQAPAPRLRSRLRRTGEQVMARFVWRRLDRIAYGTQAARDTYRVLLPTSRRLQETVVPALPPSCRCLPEADRPPEKHRLVFLGSLSERKGFPTLVDAWPLVVRDVPTARLVILGKGPLADEARAFEDQNPSVTFLEDPERSVIHAELRDAAVTVLASRSSPTWREQVGLPIVEALSHGCRIVTTTETGLAAWLSQGGHTVIPPEYDAVQLAIGLRGALESEHPDQQEVLSTLPDQDGRLLADAWMFADP